VVGGPTSHSSAASSSSAAHHSNFKPKRFERKPPGSNHYSNWDAAKLYQNMSQYSTNPVGALQERYQSRGVAPEYRMVQAEGASHCPTFSFQVFIGDMVAMGSGSSKKQAKHAAARAMLDKLDGRAPQQDGVQPLPPVTEISPPKPGEGNGAAAKEKKDGGDDSTNDGDSTAAGGEAGNGASAAAASMSNTIGQLQELCVHRGLPMPIYDLAAVDGQPHMREFAMYVRVGSLASKGEGTSKKDAKRDAALKMVAQIKALVGEGKEIAAVSGKDAEKAEEELSKEDKELAKKVEGMKIDPLTKKHSMKIQQFYRNMQDTAGSKLFLLHRTSLKSAQGHNYVRLLADLAAEQKFEVTHVEIEERTDEGETQCLVQLSCLPVTVCYGTGKDMASANQAAARNGLNYLKMMTKKSVGGTAPSSGAGGGSSNGK